MVRKLFTLIQKNIKLILRSKSSALIVIFGPLLLILLVGLAFNTANVHGIRVGVHSDDYSILTESIINGIKQEHFTVIKADTEDTCVEGIKTGFYHVCAIFPSNLNVEDGGDIKFYIDNSKINLVYLIMDTVNNEIGAKSKEISTQLTKTVVDTLSSADEELQSNEQLLTSLQNDNADLNNYVSTARNKLSNLELDIDTNQLSFATVESKLGVTTTDNLTLAALARLKRDVEEVQSKLLDARTITLNVINDLSAADAVINVNYQYITTLRSTLLGINQDIQDVKQTNVQHIVSPLSTSVHPIVSGGTYLNYLFPTLIAIIIMFVSIFLSSTLVVREKISKVHFKNFITPTSNFLFISGNFLTNLLIVLIQLFVLFLVAFFFFKELLTPILGTLFLILLIINAVFILLGILIGNLFKSEETNLIASLSVGFILLFFSSALIPVEALPTLIKGLAFFNPFYISQSLLNKLIIFHVGLTQLLNSILILLGYIIVLFILVYVTQRFVSRTE